MSTPAERSGRPARPEEAVIPGLEVSLWELMLSPENLKTEHLDSIATGLGMEPEDVRTLVARYTSRSRYALIPLKEELTARDLRPIRERFELRPHDARMHLPGAGESGKSAIGARNHVFPPRHARKNSSARRTASLPILPIRRQFGRWLSRGRT